MIGNLQFPKHKLTKQETHTYTEFTVAKPLWDEDGLLDYQTETFQTLKYLIEEFNEAEHIPILSELVAMALTLSAENNYDHS